MQKNDTSVRYSDEELEEFRALIISKLEKAQDELTFMNDQLSELSEASNNKNSADMFDDSTLHSEIEMLTRMVVRQQQFVRNLEAALQRIKVKTYGICTVTGQLIDKKRLLLVPHATKSVVGKEEEKKHQMAEPFGGQYPGLDFLSETQALDNEE